MTARALIATPGRGTPQLKSPSCSRNGGGGGGGGGRRRGSGGGTGTRKGDGRATWRRWEPLKQFVGLMFVGLMFIAWLPPSRCSHAHTTRPSSSRSSARTHTVRRLTRKNALATHEQCIRRAPRRSPPAPTAVLHACQTSRQVRGLRREWRRGTGGQAREDETWARSRSTIEAGGRSTL